MRPAAAAKLGSSHPCLLDLGLQLKILTREFQISEKPTNIADVHKISQFFSTVIGYMCTFWVVPNSDVLIARAPTIHPPPCAEGYAERNRGGHHQNLGKHG